MTTLAVLILSAIAVPLWVWFGSRCLERTKVKFNPATRVYTVGKRQFTDLLDATIYASQFGDPDLSETDVGYRMINDEMPRPLVHFVGFRGDEYIRAQRIFGCPDIVHQRWDWRAVGDICEGDTVVFANKAGTKPPSQYSYDDSSFF